MELKNIVRRLCVLGIALLTVVSFCSQQVVALTQNDFSSVYNNTPFYDPSACGGSPSDPSSQGTVSSNAPTIVIDPGHSGNDIHDTDPQTGLYDHDYPNSPEITEVFSVAQKVQQALQKDGYNVILTKKSANDSVSFRQRADIANQAKADLALSIHDSHDTSWTDMGGGDGGQVYVQHVGDYRQNKPGEGSGTQKVPFTDAQVAQKSQQYGQTFAEQRTQDEGHKVAVAPISFDSRAGLPSGNIPMVMLFSKVPWVYNEVGAPNGPLTQDEISKYAQGLADGVEKSIPASSTGSAQSSGTCCPPSNGSTAGGVPTSLTGNDNPEKAFNFFIQVGLSPAQAAGVVANFYNESSVNPATGGSPAAAAFGIAQWTPGSKFSADKQLNHITGSDTDLLTQLQVVWAEMNGKSSQGFSNIVPELEKINDPGQAAVYFRDNFERCDTSYTSCSDRASVGVTMYQKYGQGVGTVSGGSCQNSGASPDCQTASGDAKILCEAKQYDPVSYSESPAGNHMPGGNPAWLNTCKTIGPSCYLDCSGLVNIAVYDAFGYDLKENTFSEASDTSNWKHIQFNQLQPGDLIQPGAYGGGHVEIVDHVTGNTIYTFGAHTSSVPQPQQVGPASFQKASGDLYLHWIGKGSS